VVFAQFLEPPPKLPDGMTGANAKDPRYGLKPGLYDAGEISRGLKHLAFLKKPDVFRLESDNPNDPKVRKTLELIGIADTSLIPLPFLLSRAQLAFANSDIAFQGNHLFLGNFYGINIYDISESAKPKLLTSLVCPGGQGDVSVFGNLMFMSVEMINGRIDCGTESFPVSPMPAQSRRFKPTAQKDRFRGVRIFDISDIRNPKQVAAVQTCRGSHTHTLVRDPKDNKHIYVYNSGTSFVRPNEELEGCSDGFPDENPNTSLFRIDIIKVPLDSPQDAKIISSPQIFKDEKTGKIAGLTDGGSHANQGRPTYTDQCHDITVFSEIGLAAGACDGNGILLDIRDPANPKRIDAVNDPNYAYWHSATFSNDGKKVVFTDEWGGGMGARCRENDPLKWGANAIFEISGNKLKFGNYYKMPAAQGDSENCVAHNGSLIPVPGRDLKVQAWYQGGISVMDFTDPKKPVEIAYFDRGPIYPNILILGGYWSAYWYNGKIYGSEIARGLDVFELTPTEFLTQNEIDAAKLIQVAELNVQNQERFTHPRKLVVAKAYLDQLERSKALSSSEISTLRQAIQTAETSQNASKLKSFVKSLEKQSKVANNATDSMRMKYLAEILKNPAI
jgi:hypothetical protein